MKRSKIILIAVLLYSLCGCSVWPANVDSGGKEMSPEVVSDDTEASSDTVLERIETMRGWSFQYNPGTDDYSLFFGLLDEAG